MINFVECLTEYDIIFLSETWTGKQSNIDLNGYRLLHSYRKFQNRRAKRKSGGLAVYIRNNIYKGVKLIKNDIDCVMWIKLDKQFFLIQ